MTFVNTKTIPFFIILTICSLFSIISYPSGQEPIPMEPDPRIRQTVSEEAKLDFRVDPATIGEDRFLKLPTWGNDINIATGTVAGGISTTYDNDGNLYAARCTTDNGIQRGMIKIYKSTNGGQEWGLFGEVSSIGDDQFSYPELLVCQKGEFNYLYVFFLDEIDATSAIFVSRYDLDGTPGSVYFVVGEGEVSESITYYSACSNLDGDTLIVVYEADQVDKSGPPPPTPVLSSIRSTNFGGTWFDRELVASDGAHPDVAYGADGYVYVVFQKTSGSDYEIEFKRSTNYGDTWGDWEALTSDIYEDDYPKVAALHTTPADNATVWVVYNHTEGPAKIGNTELRFAYSTNSGIDWTKNQILNNSPLIDATESYEQQDCKSQPCETTPDTLWGGISAAYAWPYPPLSAYGNSYANQRFDMPSEYGGRLDQVQIVFYTGWSAGTPDPDLYVWTSDGVYPLDNNPPAGAIADFHIRYGDIIWFPSYTVVETWEQGVEFGPGESFHIGFGHVYADGDTLTGLSDDGSSGSDRSTEWWGDHWGMVLDEWGLGVDFLINAVICPFAPCEASLDTLWGGTFAYYFWQNPTRYGDYFFNERFDMPSDRGGRLERVEIAFYSGGEGCQGTPSPDIYVWTSDGLYPLDNDPPAGAIGHFQVDYDSILWFPNYTVIETWAEGIEFDPNESFHIGCGHAYIDGDTLCMLSDDGSFTSNRSVEWLGDHWSTMLNVWGVGVDFLVNAVICPSEPVPPSYDEMAADLKVYRSSSHTYVDLCYLRSAAIRQPILDVCYTWASSSSPGQFHAPHQKINDNLSNWSPDGRKVCQLTYSNLSEYPGIVYAGSPPRKKDMTPEGGWNLWFDYHPMTDVNEDVAEEELPSEFSLSANYPNPFNPVTKIQYTVGSRQTDPVALRVYNVLGQLVRTLVNEPKESGIYEVIWDGKDQNGNEVASGVYFYQLQASDFTQTRKMVLLK